MTGMAEAGPFSPASSAGSGMVSSSWEARLQDMQQLIQSRSVETQHAFVFVFRENSNRICSSFELFHGKYQALPLVSTFWGILLFGEYRKSSRRTYILLGSMLFMFIAAVGVLMASSGHRKD